MNPFGSMIFPTLNQLIHRAEAFFYLPKKKSDYHCYPIHNIIPIPRIINPNIIYICMYIVYIYIYIYYIILYILYTYHICILYVYTYIIYIYPPMSLTMKFLPPLMVISPETIPKRNFPGLRQPRSGFGLEELMLQLLHVLTLDAQ